MYLVHAVGGTPKRLTDQPSDECCASWSHDGRWIYFMSARSGQRQIWKISAEGGQAVQITKNGGHVALESHDGQYLYYSRSGGEGERDGMSSLRRVPVNGGPEADLVAAQQAEAMHQFTAKRHIIQMTVSSSEQYVGRRFTVYTGTKPDGERCLSPDGFGGRCMERFVGAVVTVRYTAKNRNGRPAKRTRLREHVTLTAQSDGLPERPPFSKTIELENGVGSDVQVFGYDESEMKESERSLMRQSGSTMWRPFRQELYIDEERNPFTIIEWKHMLNRITIVRIQPAPYKVQI